MSSKILWTNQQFKCKLQVRNLFKILTKCHRNRWFKAQRLSSISALWRTPLSKVLTLSQPSINSRVQLLIWHITRESKMLMKKSSAGSWAKVKTDNSNTSLWTSSINSCKNVWIATHKTGLMASFQRILRIYNQSTATLTAVEPIWQTSKH